MNFQLLDNIGWISPRPILFVVGEHAHSRYFGEDADELASDPKELYVVPNAGHADLYDKTDLIPFDKLEESFTMNHVSDRTWRLPGRPWTDEGRGDLRATVVDRREMKTGREETTMRGAVMYAPGDVRLEARDDPRILEPTDAIIRLSATCICGSDLWPYRGIDPVEGPVPMGHEYAGIVEELGGAVRTIRPGQFVVGSFFASDNTCEICRAGYQSSCVHREPIGAGGTQAEYARIPLADGTLVATPELPPADMIPSFLAASDVLGTGWFGAVAAEAGPGKKVAVVGDGAVGLLAVLAARQLGAERIVAMSRHAPRQKLALELGATDIVGERGDEGVAIVKELTGGLGAHSVIEAVGTQESMMQAIRSTRPGGEVGFVGVFHDVDLSMGEFFYSHVHLHGGPAPVRRFLPELVDLIWKREIDPGKVFDLAVPLEEVAEGYRAMDERRAIKVLLEL